jgi:hypothetical protein
MAKIALGKVEGIPFGQTHLSQYRNIPRKFNRTLAAPGFPVLGLGLVGD